jgi:hypothetical protein
LREISLEKRRLSKEQLRDPDIGERIKESLQTSIPTWERETQNSQESLRELQMEYFNDIRKLLLEYKTRLDADLAWLKRQKKGTDVQADCISVQDLLRDADMRLALENVNFWNARLCQLRWEKRELVVQVCILIISSWFKSTLTFTL